MPYYDYKSNIEQQHVASQQRKVAEIDKGVRPGDKEWFDLHFPANANNMPAGFRGRK